ncbi:transcriptional regulator [Streptomyces venezuelae]|nr:transcriptional regulator [Streptomyces venezuelae]CUM35757.1 hypothetical protein BN2537_479 [Streptomyces venezuelae]
MLQQCLHDEQLPLDVRAAGSLVLMFGQHLSHIVALTTEHLGETDGLLTLRLDDTRSACPVRSPLSSSGSSRNAPGTAGAPTLPVPGSSRARGLVPIVRPALWRALSPSTASLSGPLAPPH